MKIAILYICTGKYILFWDKFYQSCETFFLRHADKEYFVFTDQPLKSAPNVHRQQQENLCWPGNTLYRYHLFCNIQAQLASFDYIFFFNANCQFLTPVTADFLPAKSEELLVVQHPGFFNASPQSFTYERNPKSTAYIPFGVGEHYVCGGVNGGASATFLSMAQKLSQAISEDEQNGITAIWHDESHINKYILSHPHVVRPPSYCYPEDWEIPFTQKILIRNKKKYGGHNALRSISLKQRIIGYFRSCVQKLLEFFHAR